MQQIILWLHVSTLNRHYQANKEEHFIKVKIGIKLIPICTLIKCSLLA